MTRSIDISDHMIRIGINRWIDIRCTWVSSTVVSVDLVVKASASRAVDPGFDSRLRRDFSVSIHTSDLNIGTPVAILPGAWRSRVSTGTGRPGVCILRLGEIESVIRNFYLSVARKIVELIRP